MFRDGWKNADFRLPLWRLDKHEKIFSALFTHLQVLEANNLKDVEVQHVKNPKQIVNLLKQEKIK